MKRKIHQTKEKLKMAEMEKRMLRSDLEALREHTIRVNTTVCEIFEVTCKNGHIVRPQQPPTNV
jgi:hypothetical protein